MSSLSQKLAGAKFAFKDLSFCVDGTLNKQRDELMVQLALAQRTEEQKAGDKRINLTPVQDIKEQIAAVEDRMREHLITVRLTAVNNGLWQKWILQNPPRKNNALDQSLGYNTDVFFDTALRASGKYVEQLIVDDEGADSSELSDISPSEWGEILEVITAGDWDRICTTLLTLNQKDGQRGTDFLLNGSRVTPNSEPTSDSPATSE